MLKRLGFSRRLPVGPCRQCKPGYFGQASREVLADISKQTRPFHWRLTALVVFPIMLAMAWIAPGIHAAGQARQIPRPSHHARKTLVTGSDGSQTGTASFLGNFTAVETTSGALALAREPDCSLTLVNGNYTYTASSINYSETTMASDYQDVLHKEAQLTTTPDVFASGCATKPPFGFGSQPGVYVGRTTSGVFVYAALGYLPAQMVNGVYLLTGTTSLALTSFQDSTSGNLTTADLNGDGNGDLVITNMSLATSSYVTVMLGNTDGSFQNGVTYPIAGNYSVAAVIDDVNGDGKPDIVAVSGDQQISVLLGNGDGTFQAATSLAAPTLPGFTSPSQTPIVNLITADLRGIGKKDVICSNGLVLLGNGDGTFTPKASPAFPYYFDPLSVIAPNLSSGDLNKDGKIDLVLNNSYTVSTWMGNGDGTFTQGSTYATLSTSGSTVVTDLDGDGNADIFVGLGDGAVYAGDQGSPNLAYALMGHGDGTFQGAPQLGFGAYTGNNLADVTGSGTLDLITNAVNTPYGSPVTVVPSFTVQLGNGKGAFNTASTITPPASFPLSGTTVTGANTTAASAYAVADINGDGKADLIFVDDGLLSGTGSLSPLPVYFTALSNGDGTFQNPVPFAFAQIAPAGDFDNTLSVSDLQIASLRKGGPADLIFTFDETAGAAFGGPAVNPYNEGFLVLHGNGDGTFGAPVITTTYSSTTAPNANFLPQILNIVDLNGDGNSDMLVLLNNYSPVTASTVSQLEVYLGNGDGTFQSPTTLPAGPTVTLPSNVYTSCILANLTNNGKLDLGCLGSDPSGQTQLAIWLGNGDGTFAAPTTLNLQGGVLENGGGIEGSIAEADFNADGNMDLAVFLGNSFNGIYYGNGDGTFTSVNTGTASAPELVPQDLINIVPPVGPVVAVDLNGDGKPDLLASNTILLNIYGEVPSSTPAVGTTTALSASAATAAVSTSITLTATVTAASGSTTPTGTVTFMNGTTTLGNGTLNSSGVATLATTQLPQGSDSITAVYVGNSSFSASTSSAVTITISAASALVATTTTLSASATSAAAGISLTFTAQVSPASGTATPTGTVTFTDGTTSLGTGSLNSSGQATLAISSLSIGTHSIVAQYGGSTAFAASMSAAVNVSITTPAPDFSLSISPSSGAETGSAPATATVTVTPENGFNASVSFACSGQPSGISCSFSPASVQPNGSPATTTVTFSGAASASSHPNLIVRRPSALLAGLGFGVLLLVRLRRKRTIFDRIALCFLAVTLFLVASCGGSGSGGAKTQTSTVTITATAGSTSHALSYSLTASE